MGRLPMKPNPVLLACAIACSLSAETFRDPAPPVVHDVPAIPPPVAKPHPDVRVHGKPKPLPAGAVTHDWKSFLGPTHNAVSSETKLLLDWPDGGPKLVWEMKKGTGYSSPAISGDYLVYFHRVGDLEKVECLHPETGAAYWEFSYPTQFEDRYGYNNGPRASPVIDGDRVYVYGAEGKLHCLHLKTGQLYWKRDIAKEFKVPQDFFGTATTPLIEGDLLIINVGAPGGPTVAAFDKRSGKMVWGAGKEWGPSYASPVPATVHGKRRVFVFAGGESDPPTGGLLSINPANGAIDFAFPFRSRSYESVNASSPVVVDNQVFISASYRTGGALLNLLPDGKHSVAWTSREIGTHFNTAVEKDGYLYAFDGRNEPDASLVCVERKTGKLMWRVTPEWDETLIVNGAERKQRLGAFRGTLLAVDGRFLCLGELGHLLWLDLSPKGYKELKRAWLFAARETWSLPVLSRGLLYISQHSRDVLHNTPPRLLCYDLRAAK
ncbi:MAG: PQQ-like beta-propeller repeat protein [Bryobacteraceae bacterium]|nr:PQQ-like beta-propeller repeat protein [Bryobacteraceae bacterium]